MPSPSFRPGTPRCSRSPLPGSWAPGLPPCTSRLQRLPCGTCAVSCGTEHRRAGVVSGCGAATTLSMEGAGWARDGAVGGGRVGRVRVAWPPSQMSVVLMPHGLSSPCLVCSALWGRALVCVRPPCEWCHLQDHSCSLCPKSGHAPPPPRPLLMSGHI